MIIKKYNTIFESKKNEDDEIIKDYFLDLIDDGYKFELTEKGYLVIDGQYIKDKYSDSSIDYIYTGDTRKLDSLNMNRYFIITLSKKEIDTLIFSKIKLIKKRLNINNIEIRTFNIEIIERSSYSVDDEDDDNYDDSTHNTILSHTDINLEIIDKNIKKSEENIEKFNDICNSMAMKPSLKTHGKSIYYKYIGLKNKVDRSMFIKDVEYLSSREFGIRIKKRLEKDYLEHESKRLGLSFSRFLKNLNQKLKLINLNLDESALNLNNDYCDIRYSENEKYKVKMYCSIPSCLKNEDDFKNFNNKLKIILSINEK